MEESRVLLLRHGGGEQLVDALGSRGWRVVEVVTDDLDAHTVLFSGDDPDLECWLVTGPIEPLHLRLIGDGVDDELAALAELVPHVSVEDLVAVIPAIDEEPPLLAALRSLRYLVDANPTDVDDGLFEQAVALGLDADDPEIRWESALALALRDGDRAAALLPEAIERETDPDVRADLASLLAEL